MMDGPPHLDPFAQSRLFHVASKSPQSSCPASSRQVIVTCASSSTVTFVPGLPPIVRTGIVAESKFAFTFTGLYFPPSQYCITEYGCGPMSVSDPPPELNLSQRAGRATV